VTPSGRRNARRPRVARALAAALLASGLAARIALAQEPQSASAEPPRARFDHARGAFEARFDALPEEATPAAMLARLDPGRAPGEADRPLDLATEAFFVFVPESYSPERPHGLFVWISPTDSGAVRRPEMRALLAERRLIWVGAQRGGNDRALLDRHALALAAAAAAPRHWAIDIERIYVGGYSGGGRMASHLVLRWPERFRGGVFVMGCNWFEPLPIPGRPGLVWPAAFAPPDEVQRRLLRKRSRLVFLTGEHDFNREQTHLTAKAARRAGMRKVEVLEAPGIDHYGLVPIDLWRRALATLDGGA